MGPGQLLVLLAVFCVAGVRYAAAGAVVDVGADPHPLLDMVRAGPGGPEWPARRHHRVHRRDDRGGQHQFRMAYPAGPGGPDRAHRAGAGPAGGAGGAHPDRAGIARRRRPSHVADRGPGGDRAVSPPDLPEPVRAEFASLSAGGPRGTDGDAAPARRAAPRRAGRARAAAAAIRPARARRRRPASRDTGRAVHALRGTRAGCLPASALCAYRIVQEALSNASRHAPGAAVTVSVDHDADALLLRGGQRTRRRPARSDGDQAGPRADRHARAGRACSAGRSRPGRRPAAASRSPQSSRSPRA